MYINDDPKRLDYVISAEERGKKVIDVMARGMQLSGRMIRHAKQTRQVALNGILGSVNQRVAQGDVISVYFNDEHNTFDPEPIPVDVIYEDGDVMAINKPPFLVVHPTSGHPDGTLANALSYLQHQKGEAYKVRFINRLDRDTSGIVLVAKNAYAQQMVTGQMMANAVDKIYYAVVEGTLEPREGSINAPIGHRSDEGPQRLVSGDGLPSVTHYRVLVQTATHALVRIELETGRTHQIRVHFNHIGHPLVGDTLYGTRSALISRQALHCGETAFEAPRHQKRICAVAPLPADFKRLLRTLELETPEIERRLNSC